MIQLRKITLAVCAGQEQRALSVAQQFVTDYPRNHRAKDPWLHGVGFRFSDTDTPRWFFAYGDERHVRVTQREGSVDNG